MERWVLLRKGADFEAISKKFHISPRLASLIRNRDVIGDEAINQYLNGTIAELYDGMQMKGMPQAVELKKSGTGKKSVSLETMTVMGSMRHIFF